MAGKTDDSADDSALSALENEFSATVEREDNPVAQVAMSPQKARRWKRLAAVGLIVVIALAVAAVVVCRPQRTESFSRSLGSGETPALGNDSQRQSAYDYPESWRWSALSYECAEVDGACVDIHLQYGDYNADETYRVAGVNPQNVSADVTDEGITFTFPREESTDVVVRAYWEDIQSHSHCHDPF